MKTQIIISLCLILTLSVSCSRPTPDHKVISLNPEVITDFYEANVSLVRIMELENSQHHFLGHVVKVVIHNQNHYLLNNTGNFNELFKYDKDGSFLVKIGTIGHGPGEYINVSDFTINPTDGNVYVLNQFNEILKYSEQGEFIGIAQNGISSSSFELVENDMFYRFHGNPENLEKQILSVSNRNGTIKAILHNTQYKSGQFDEINFFRNGEKIYFRELYDNKIYQLNKTNVLPIIEFDIGEYNFNPDFANLDIFSLFQELSIKGSFLAFTSALTCNEWFYAYFSNEKDLIGYHVLYNYITDEKKTFKINNKIGLYYANLIDENGALGYVVSGITLREILRHNEFEMHSLVNSDIADDSTWVVWLAL